MNGASITIGPTLFPVLAALTLLAATVFGLTRLGSGAAVVRAAARAVLQLGAVSLIILTVLESWWSTSAFIAVMYVVASLTSARRISSARAGWVAALPIGLGVLPALGLLLASRSLPATPLAVLPTAGILIGGAMTATTLAGRRSLDELHARHGEYEAGLALGFGRRDAVLEVCREPAGQALVPALDQTRTVGLVTLPGAFVGVLLGGASPVQAGVTQLLILVALLAVETIAIAATVELIARGVLRRDPSPIGRIGPR
ncbi:ABC transporter permease [Micromonospora sp. NBC_01699]|uniref:ABC transporter permease n=1 Tax=Micromonospora sp. NBC_01699 TaxID=2975984 RepID=UPI002E2BF70A|nr:ABC transporter permease [Micromonospora sp. NBC_01699]